MPTLQQTIVIAPRDSEPYVLKGNTARTTGKSSAITYPDSDGKPMGETGFHVRAILHLYGALTLFFQQRGDIYVAADMFWYYQEGNPRANKSPDVMVIKGVDNHERRSFKSWEEGATPRVIFEITSESSMVEDMVTKSSLYARLGVREYFIFDPMREYVSSRMLGFRLREGEYEAVTPESDGRVFSEESDGISSTGGATGRTAGATR